MKHLEVGVGVPEGDLLWGLHPQGLGGLMGQQLMRSSSGSLAGVCARRGESSARTYAWGRRCLFTSSLSRFILLSHALTLIFSLIPLTPTLVSPILTSLLWAIWGQGTQALGSS